MRNRHSLRVASPATVEAERAATAVVGAAIAVHTKLGPGLLERIYEACLAHELRRLGHEVEQQVQLPVEYDGVKLDAAFRVDLRVDGSVIVEVKASLQLLPVHRAQLLTYLRLSGSRVGLLINFHEVRLKNGLERVVL